MEFFIVFGALMGISNPAVQMAYGIDPLPVYWAYIISAVVFLVLYTFKAVGLSTMAKKRGMDKKVWAAFVPFASTWLIGELAGPVRVGKGKFAYFGLLTMLAEILLVVFYALYYIPMAYAISQGLYVINTYEKGDSTYIVVDYLIGNWNKVMNVAYIAEKIVRILYLVICIFLYMGFFRAYAPMSYIWLDILCLLFPVVGILAFAFRNRKPVDYDKFVQARMEQMRRAQQYGPYGPYGPYGQNPNVPPENGQYRQPPYGGQGGAPSGNAPDPFGEFSSQPSDPFGDFSGHDSAGKDDDKKDGQDGFSS